ncbi:MAG: helix-turn-helix domain-containing protein [Polyangiales bacterium]
MAARIAAVRRAAGVTQEALAVRVGTSPRALQRIEAGEQNLTLKTVARIAAALGVAPEELVVAPK